MGVSFKPIVTRSNDFESENLKSMLDSKEFGRGAPGSSVYKVSMKLKRDFKRFAKQFDVKSFKVCPADKCEDDCKPVFAFG